MRSGLCRFKIDFKSSVALALHEVRDIPPTHSDDDLQISGARLRSVDAERHGLSHDSIRNIRHCHPICVVSFYKEWTPFYVSRRQANFDTMVSHVYRSEGSLEFVRCVLLGIDLGNISVICISKIYFSSYLHHQRSSSGTKHLDDGGSGAFDDEGAKPTHRDFIQGFDRQNACGRDDVALEWTARDVLAVESQVDGVDCGFSRREGYGVRVGALGLSRGRHQTSIYCHFQITRTGLAGFNCQQEQIITFFHQSESLIL